MTHTALHSTSVVAGPAKGSGIHYVHLAAVFRPPAGVSTGEVVVVGKSTGAAASAIAKRDGPSISSQNHHQPP